MRRAAPGRHQGLAGGCSRQVRSRGAFRRSLPKAAGCTIPDAGCNQYGGCSCEKSPRLREAIRLVRYTFGVVEAPCPRGRRRNITIEIAEWHFLLLVDGTSQGG